MALSDLNEWIGTEQENICEIVAIKDGKTAYEGRWHGYAPTDALHVMSATKSVVSLLVGIAIDRGLIRDVGQRVLDFFPEYIVKRGEKTIQSVTIEHLLTMTAPYKYRSEPWSKVCSSEDWTAAALDLLGGREGLTGAFRYSTLGVHILTGILKQVSGQRTVDFANQVLFEPLGIPPHQSYLAATAEQHKEFILSKKPKGDIWFSDPQGVAAAGYGLCLCARDMAAIGEMLLNRGTYHGKRIVSEEWVAESTRPRTQCDERFAHMSYGYLWWSPEKGERCYAAIGDGGNVIYVDPKKELVVAVAATFKPRVFDRVQMIREKIVPLLG